MWFIVAHFFNSTYEFERFDKTVQKERRTEGHMNREKYAQRDISIERLTYRKTKDLRIEGHTHKSIDVQKGTRIERHGLRTEICTQTRNTRIEAYAVFQHRFSQKAIIHGNWRQ